MARIRSLKPSIWTDERFIGLSRDARLLCIGMISHADDQGRLLATAVKLAGDIFPADDLRPGVVRDWRREIEGVGLIEVYAVNGIEYAQFPRWGRHQRISRPQPSTLPGAEQANTRPRNDSALDRGMTPQRRREPVRTRAQPSRAEARPRLGDRRQETGVPPSAGAERAAIAEPIAESDRPPDGTQTLIAEWIDHVPKRPPRAVVGQVGKHLRAMLAEGIDPVDLRRGLAAWVAKGLAPSVLPSVVNEVMNSANGGHGRRSTTDQRVAAGLALAAELEGEEPRELGA